MEGITYSFENLSIGYCERHEVKVLAKGLCAELRRGELTCLLGVNGSGKSTLLRTLAGFQRPLAGVVTLLGKRLEDYTRAMMSRTVGVVLTEAIPTGNLTAYELTAMGRLPYTGFWGGLSATDCRVVENALERVGMLNFRNRRIGELSDGERQKVLIAKALAQRTQVILLDEPTCFLDFPSKVEMLRLLKGMARDESLSVLLSIHDLELALQTADRLWILSGEGKLMMGEPRDLAAKGELDMFFKGEGVTFDREELLYRMEKGI